MGFPLLAQTLYFFALLITVFFALVLCLYFVYRQSHVDEIDDHPGLLVLAVPGISSLARANENP